MANNKQKQQTSKQKFGTLTALSDANGDYSTTSAKTTSKTSSSKQQASKSEYGTLTAKSDANNDYQ